MASDDPAGPTLAHLSRGQLGTLVVSRLAVALVIALEVAPSSGPACSQLADAATSAFVHGYSHGAVVLPITTVAGVIAGTGTY